MTYNQHRMIRWAIGISVTAFSLFCMAHGT